jgi:hypothetical protein
MLREEMQKITFVVLRNPEEDPTSAVARVTYENQKLQCRYVFCRPRESRTSSQELLGCNKVELTKSSLRRKKVVHVDQTAHLCGATTEDAAEHGASSAAGRVHGCARASR